MFVVWYESAHLLEIRNTVNSTKVKTFLKSSTPFASEYSKWEGKKKTSKKTEVVIKRNISSFSSPKSGNIFFIMWLFYFISSSLLPLSLLLFFPPHIRSLKWRDIRDFVSLLSPLFNLLAFSYKWNTIHLEKKNSTWHRFNLTATRSINLHVITLSYIIFFPSHIIASKCLLSLSPF